MTRLEAIAILDGFKYNPLLNDQHFEALDMAVSALSKYDTEPTDEQVAEYCKARSLCLITNALMTEIMGIRGKHE